MMRPNTQTLWRYVGPHPGHGDIQRVIWSDELEVVTVTETVSFGRTMWSWLGDLADFAKSFTFVGEAAQR